MYDIKDAEKFEKSVARGTVQLLLPAHPAVVLLPLYPLSLSSPRAIWYKSNYYSYCSALSLCVLVKSQPTHWRLLMPNDRRSVVPSIYCYKTKEKKTRNTFLALTIQLNLLSCCYFNLKNWCIQLVIFLSTLSLSKIKKLVFTLVFSSKRKNKNNIKEKEIYTESVRVV